MSAGDRSPVAIARWDWLIFPIFPHLNHEMLPDNSMANAEKWAASIPEPGYDIDDQTTIKVID